MIHPSDLDEAVRIVDRLAELAGDDLDMVTCAIHRFTIPVGRDIAVDIEAAERWIRMEMDAKEFEA